MEPSEAEPESKIEVLKSRVDQIFKPLSNAVRLKILFILAEGPVSYTDILSMTGLESGSFYWHIRKMEGLYTQTVDKKYMLTPTGKKVLSLILGEPEQESVVNVPPPLQSALSTISRITAAPTWFILQQSILVYLLLAGLYNAAQMVQVGLLVDFTSSNTLSQPALSILFWVLMFDIWMTVIVWAHFRIRRDFRRPPRTLLLTVFSQNPVFILPFFLPGIVIGLILILAGPASFLSSIYFQGGLVLFSNLIYVIFETLYLMEVFDIEIRDAMLTAFVMVYPMAIISFLLL